jgi:orotidine-5'-phosphate decarboxylase
MIQEFYLSLIFSTLSLADLKLADIGSTNENLSSPDGTACNLRIQKPFEF